MASERTEISQYLIHPALRPQLDAWLHEHGFRIDRLPPALEGRDTMPTFLVSPTGARLRAVGHLNDE